MSNLKTRVRKMEEIAGRFEIKEYMLVTLDLSGRLDAAEENAKGYKIQCCIPSFGGTGEGPFYIETVPDLLEFAARPDVNLRIYVFGEVPPDLAHIKAIIIEPNNEGGSSVYQNEGQLPGDL
jgi:hypothetical protein